jgi:hypothetical protein
MTTVLRNEPIEVALEWINKLTPHVWNPTFKFYMELLSELRIQRGSQYMPKIWTDLQENQFCAVKREVRFEFIAKISEALVHLGADLGSEAADEAILSRTYGKIAKEMFGILNSIGNMKQPRTIHDAVLCNGIVTLGLRHGDLSLSKSVVTFCQMEVTRLPDNLSCETLSAFVTAMIETEDFGAAFRAVVLAAELNFGVEASKMAAEVGKAFPLTETQRNQFNSLFSHDPNWVLV